jgi:hypothetical protein
MAWLTLTFQRGSLHHIYMLHMSTVVWLNVRPISMSTLETAFICLRCLTRKFVFWCVKPVWRQSWLTKVAQPRYEFRVAVVPSDALDGWRFWMRVKFKIQNKERRIHPPTHCRVHTDTNMMLLFCLRVSWFIDMVINIWCSTIRAETQPTSS